jgi:tRNA A-37 threonylcarbamoyl transferase component Bud32
MKLDELDRIARELKANRPPAGVKVLKSSPVRIVAHVGDSFLKIFRNPRSRPKREASALREAARRGLPVPELIGIGSDWIATRFVEARAAHRQDLPEILTVVRKMHASGMVHRDLHLGNLVVGPSGIVLTDLQRARFLPWIPGPLRRMDLGWLAYSLGDPLPEPLAEAERWRSFRAHTHWRSRTRRCLKESGGFTRFHIGRLRCYRRRDTDAEEMARLFEDIEGGERIKDRPGASLFRKGAWILKEHRSWRAARRSWINGQGLEVRGIATGRAVAWAGRWLAMEDAGPTVTDFVDHRFFSAGEAERTQLVDALAALMANLHARGIYHADLKANNIAWLPGRPPRLLDYGRVRFRWRVGRRRRAKNLAQLNAALPDVVSATLREHGLRRYLEQSAFRGDAAALRARVIQLSLRRHHRWHGC